VTVGVTEGARFNVAVTCTSISIANGPELTHASGRITASSASTGQLDQLDYLQQSLNRAADKLGS